MSDRRSSRPRKRVDYSKFASVNTDCDDEDDFVDDSTPPPQKSTKKETKSRSKKDPQPKIIDTIDKGKRRSLDEKLYTRDLQLALEKSTVNDKAFKNSNSDASKSHNEPPTVNESTQSNGEDSPSAKARLQQSGPPQVRATGKGDEKRRQAAATATQKITEECSQDQDEETSNNDDEEYKVENEVASDDASSEDDEDFEESDDEGSDFEVTHKSPSRKKTSERSAIKVKITKSVAGKPAKRSLHASVNTKSNFPTTSKVTQSTGDDSQITKTQPAVKKPVPQLSATSSRSPFSGSGLRSPCGSTLRLGLSRRVHVKPLHAMAKNMQQT